VDFEGELVHLDWAAADAEIAALGGPARAARWLHCCVSVPGQLPSDQRWVAWAMLGRCGRSAEEVVPELVAAMCSDATEDRERIAAAIALGRIGGPRAAGYLVLAMREKRYEIRCLAQSGLAEFEPAELSSVLIPVLDRGDAQARSMAVRLLGRRGDFRAVPVLEAALRTEADRGVTEDIRLALAELRRRLADR
jgi:HEAT repeat protein